MITANELRIGNWLNERNRKYVGKSVYPFQVEVQHLKMLEGKSTWKERIEGIPLTTDIVLKCGFEDSNKDNPEYLRCYTYGDIEFFPPQGDEYKDREGITISCSDSYYDRNLPHIKHLHQLQNLYFALCGVELKVELTGKELEINL